AEFALASEFRARTIVTHFDEILALLSDIGEVLHIGGQGNRADNFFKARARLRPHDYGYIPFVTPGGIDQLVFGVELRIREAVKVRREVAHTTHDFLPNATHCLQPSSEAFAFVVGLG